MKMEYKRLTKLSDLGTLHALDFNGEEQPLCELTALDIDALIRRLYELENKIESGELGDVKELKQELKAQEGAANAYRIFFGEQKYWREVAEKALQILDDYECLCNPIDYYMKRAEKELEEEKKNE